VESTNQALAFDVRIWRSFKRLVDKPRSRQSVRLCGGQTTNDGWLRGAAAVVRQSLPRAMQNRFSCSNNGMRSMRSRRVPALAGACRERSER
jgi:hypothetical protein